MKLAVCVLLIVVTASVASAQIGVTANMTAQPIAGGFQYDITLNDTGTTGIGTLWFSWIPGQGYLPTLPTNIMSPAGWSSQITDGPPPADGYSIQWVAGTPMTAGTSLSGFSFDSTDSPATLEGNSSIHPGQPILTSVVYQGGPFAGASETFVATLPEPASASMLALGAIWLVLRRRRI